MEVIRGYMCNIYSVYKSIGIGWAYLGIIYAGAGAIV